MKKFTIAFLLLIMLAALSANLLWDDSVAIRQGVNIEWFRTGTETADGGAIYVWSDTKSGERDLYAQKVDAQGNLVWGQPKIIDQKPDRQEDPVITNTSDGGFIIAWIDFSSDLDGDVYAQKIDAQGQLLWPAGGKPVCTLPGFQISLNIEPDNAGGAYIVWEDSRNPSKDIYGQRMDANGNQAWATNGLPVANGIGNESQNTMWADGQGGMIIGYHYVYVSEENLYAKRFGLDGTMLWAQATVVSEAPGIQSKIRMSPVGNGEFVFTWQDERSGNPDIYAQKINLSGQLLWNDPFSVYNDSSSSDPTQQLNPRIVSTSDNAVVIIWEDKRLDAQNPDLFGQKVSSAGQLLWNAAGVAITTAEFAQVSPRMVKDDNGGIFMVWDDARNDNSPNWDIYGQHLSSTGTALWDANGKAICTAPNEQSGCLIKVSNNNVFVNWMDMRNGSVGIYYQAMSQSGNLLLAENGIQVFWGLSGDATLDQFIALPQQDKMVVIWQDTRSANIGYQIYFQIVNPDGSVLLEENGKPVTLHSGNGQLYPDAVVTPSGEICVVWEDRRQNNPKIFAQLLSATGERLWGDYGMELTEATPISQISPKVTYINGSFYIGWSNSDLVGSSQYYHTYGQKITNNQKQWGPNGVIISDLAPNELNYECLFSGITGMYYYWTRTDPIDPSLNTVWVKLVTENGTAATGWENAGKRVSDYSGFDTIQIFPQAYETPQGIMVLWQDLRTDFLKNIYGQHISNTGEYLWNSSGVSMVDYGREQEMQAAVTSNSGIVFAWAENMDGTHDIGIQKYSYAGNPLWGPMGNFVVQRDSTQNNPTIKRFSNGGMIVAWSDYSSFEPDIQYKYVNDDASFVGDNWGYVMCNEAKSQYRPMAVPTDNTAFVVWSDGRSSGKTEILGLFAQRVNNQCVGNNDQINIPTPAFTLLQNNPNPFNPETQISFVVDNNRSNYELIIYNTKGQKVKTLHKGLLDKGYHSLIWNGMDSNNSRVSSGIYFYQLSNGSSTQTKKMVLVK